MNKMSLEEYKGVFVFAQQVDNVLDGVAFELLGKGKDLAKDLNTEVTAVLIGSGVKGLADQLAAVSYTHLQKLFSYSVDMDTSESTM